MNKRKDKDIMKERNKNREIENDKRIIETSRIRRFKNQKRDGEKKEVMDDYKYLYGSP
jgi:hypothetical protein